MNDSSGEMEENRNRLSLSPSPSRESNASNLEDDLDLSSPNSSSGKKSSHKDGGSHSSKQGPSPKSSRENTPEKRSSEREKSSDREKTPDEGSDKDKRLSESPDDTKPSTSAPSTSKNAPSASPSASTSAAPEKKRKSAFTEEELKQAIKRHKKQDEERMKMQVLVSNFSEEQLNRYEMFRRATFPRAAIKRLMQNITGTTVSQNVVIAMSGISKVFVGEVLETALDVSEKWGDSGPLQPKHLREAVRVLNSKGMMPSTKSKKCLF